LSDLKWYRPGVVDRYLDKVGPALPGPLLVDLRRVWDSKNVVHQSAFEYVWSSEDNDYYDNTGDGKIEAFSYGEAFSASMRGEPVEDYASFLAWKQLLQECVVLRVDQMFYPVRCDDRFMALCEYGPEDPTYYMAGGHRALWNSNMQPHECESFAHERSFPIREDLYTMEVEYEDMEQDRTNYLWLYGARDQPFGVNGLSLSSSSSPGSPGTVVHHVGGSGPNSDAAMQVQADVPVTGSVAIVYTGIETRYFVDGAFVGAVATTRSDGPPNPNDFCLGADEQDSGNRFYGTISTMRVWKGTALSDHEVAVRHNLTIVAPPSPPGESPVRLDAVECESQNERVATLCQVASGSAVSLVSPPSPP
jgi:hypothetical protein